MHKRTKATSIPREVKRKVYERDGHHCVFCGRWVEERNACAHYIPRSQGGLGIEQNILTLCDDCHREYDQTLNRKALKRQAQAYLEAEYGYIDERDLVYDKWRDLNWGTRE